MTIASIRASDAERDQVTAILQRAVAEGRLTPEEGGERLAAAGAARYRDELARLLGDLPASLESPSPLPARPRTPWFWIAARFVRGVVFASLVVGAFALWGGFFLPFWLFGLAALAFGSGARRRRYWRARWRGRMWYGAPWSYGPSSRPW